MKQFLITVAGVLVGMTLFVIVVPIVIFSMIMSSISDRPAGPPSMVLALDLRHELADQRSRSPFSSWGGHGENVLDVVTMLDAAARDNRVKGIVVRAASDGMSPAHAEEVRAALAAFQQSGKFVIAHITNEGARMSMPGYSAIAGADQIWLQGVSGIMPMGLSAEGAFLGDTLRRYRLLAQFETREEYKSGPAVLTETGFTPAHREETQALLDSLYATMVATIAQDRELTPEAVRSAIEATPLASARAVELGLVDQLGQAEEAIDAALERAGRGAEMVEFQDYYPPPVRRGGAVIAVVTGEGEIYNGVSDEGFFGDSQAMNGDDIAQALRDAADDEDVRAIVFRVSSPGGSPAASDQILAALRYARAQNKPVVVSMGDVAASGGYYVAAEANEIVANPMTITGSIGVYGGKIVLGPALEHYLSVRTESMSVGSPLVRMMTSDEAFTNEGRAAYAAIIDRTYQEFMTRVATGRRLTVAQVREVARGRVWTGEQARARGLVDHLGGFELALQRARVLAEIPEDRRVELRYFPAARSPFEELQMLFGASSQSVRAAVALGALLDDEQMQALIRAARQGDAGVRMRADELNVR